MHPITLYVTLPRNVTARDRQIYALLEIAADDAKRVRRPLAWIARHIGQRGKGGGSITASLRRLAQAQLLVEEASTVGLVWRLK